MGSRGNSPKAIQKGKNTVGWRNLGRLQKEAVPVKTLLEAWVAFGSEEEAPSREGPAVRAR